MSYYDIDDILGYHFHDGSVQCAECAVLEPDDEDEIITKDNYSDGYYAFCDLCKKKII